MNRTMNRIFEFSSDQFPRAEEDDELVNSDSMHGHALASFLADKLRDQGFATGAFVGEDWGWYCPVETDGPADVHYGCTGEDDHFIVQVHPRTAHVRRWFKKVPVGDAPDRLANALYDIVTQTGTKSGPAWIG